MRDVSQLAFPQALKARSVRGAERTVRYHGSGVRQPACITDEPHLRGVGRPLVRRVTS